MFFEMFTTGKGMGSFIKVGIWLAQWGLIQKHLAAWKQSGTRKNTDHSVILILIDHGTLLNPKVVEKKTNALSTLMMTLK